ncbi:putative RIMS-binding protein 2 [Hypsibius exemplaris]|uniref:RIMS-binding protein 2 n=1 Tax=Hypsibius exemplaris TaxID=2072580 RepID=A0A1W0XCV8_HYPEX|nr:putative RIMS-binding protein 2 [Hypsibius exemplaris]
MFLLLVRLQALQDAVRLLLRPAGSSLTPRKCMREAAEKRKELELEYQEAKEQLREKQIEIKQLHKNEVVGKRKHQEVIESLESKLRELEKKCELQAVRFEELSLEMTSVQRQASRSRSLANMTTSEVQTSPESGTSTPDSALSGVKMVNGEGPRPAATTKPRLGHQKSDSGLGSSLDESVSSRKDSATSFARSRQLLHPLSESVDRAVDAGSQGSDHHGQQKLSVFVSKFAYIPAKQSPNLDIRDSELELKKGEYVIVFGDMDEDGYYEGETLEGRRGLIPSNFVDRLPPEELVDFHASYPNNPAMQTTAAAATNQQRYNSTVFNVAHQQTANQFNSLSSNQPYAAAPARGPHFGNELRPDNTQHRHSQHQHQPSSSSLSSRPSDFNQKLPSAIASATRETGSEDPNVPAPSNLALEKQMHKSIMIGWSAAMAPPGFVETYNVYVNRERKTSVRANERCRALVEGIDLSSCHRVSVRTCTGAGRESLDSLCTILVGKDCPVMPSDVRVINITANSATVTWIPANTNYQHSIFVNEKEYAIVPPSSHRFIIPDLSSSTEYRVHVVPIVPRSTINYSSYLHACAQVGFKTLPDNVPDPPSTLQLESGPQDGTLLLTWAPVVPQRNCDVVGYAIYADGQKVQQIDSPTGDHALLDITRFQSAQLPRNLTVRTISSKNLSRDSPFLSVTEDVLLGQIKAVAQAQTEPPYSSSLLSQPPPPSQQQQQQQQLHTLSGTLPPSSYPSSFGPQNRQQQQQQQQQQNTVTFRDLPPQQQHQRGGPLPPPQQQQQQQLSRPPSGNHGDLYNNAGDDALTDILEEAEEEALMDMKRPLFDSFGRRILQPLRTAMRSLSRPFPLRNSRDMEFGGGGGGGPPPQMMLDGGPRFGGPPGGPWTNHRPMNRPFDGMSSGFQGPQSMGFNNARGLPGPGGPRDMRDPRNHDPGLRRYGGGGPDPYRSFYDEDFYRGGDHHQGRHMQSSFAMHERTSSLPQIEITKDDSFESMDSRHRAFSDREADDRGHGGRGMRSRYNSPPNDSAYRRQRSQSRDRFDDSARNRSQERYGGYVGNDHPSQYAPQQQNRRQQQQRPAKEIPAGRYEYPDEQPQSTSRMRNDSDAVDPRRLQGSYSLGGTLERKSKLVRLFRTNVDWNAATDSPNADAASEELSFKKNELIKISGHKDSDGYYKGELLNSGRHGLVPCNLVDKVDDEAIIRRYLGDDAFIEKAPRPSAMKGQKGPSSVVQNHLGNEGPPRKNPVRKMIAKYDYNASESPNPDFEKELSFKKGDVIFVSGMDDDGFYESELNGKRGLVPSNFLLDPTMESMGSVSDLPPPMLTRVPSLREPSTSRGPAPSNARQPNAPTQQQQQSSRSSLQANTTAQMHSSSGNAMQLPGSNR